MTEYLPTTVLAYLCGSIPFGFLTAKLTAGVDIRTAGSGNPGATNVARVLGLRWGILVLCFDCLKGLLPTLLLPCAFAAPEDADFQHLRILSGVLAIVGHMFSVWLKFRGGKGVATGLGVIMVVSWQATLISFAMFTACALTTRIVSLASMLAAVAFGTAWLWLHAPDPFSHRQWSTAAFAVGVPLLIVFQHRANIVRLAKGTEPRFTLKKDAEP